MTDRADSKSQDPSTSLEHYLAPLRDHRKVILLVAVVTLVLGALMAVAGPRSYTARTSVLIYPVSADPTEALKAADSTDDMATERRIADSRTVADLAATELQELGIDVTSGEAAAAISINNPEDSRVLTISYQASDPAVARVGSELTTASYLAYRSELNAASRQIARTSISDQISVLQDRLAATDEQIDRAAAGSAALLVAEIEQASIEGELEAQQKALADLSILSIDAATVFDAAREPSSADGIGAAQLLVGALAGGLVLGVIAAWTVAALGLDPSSLRAAIPTGRSARSDDDDDDDVDSPFDDSDRRDPLELLKALEAIEDDPAITLDPPSTSTTNQSETPPVTPPPVLASTDAEPRTETGPEPQAQAELEIETIGAPLTAFDTNALSTLTQPTAIETADPDPFDTTPFQLDSDTGFDDETGFGTAADVVGETETTESDLETGFGFDDETDVEIEPDFPVEADTGFEPQTDTGFAVEVEVENDLEVGIATGFGLSGTQDDVQVGVDVESPTIEPEAWPDTEAEPFGHDDADGEPDEAEASQNTADPNDLTPGPPSWDGPFVGPTTWEQLSALAAATEQTDAEVKDDIETDVETETQVSLDTVSFDTDTDTDTDTEQLATEPMPSAATELFATSDVDALFEQMGQLGSAGPVAVLSLSDRNPAAGLTAGFELADELRAVGANVLLIDARIEHPVLDTLFGDGPGVGLAQVMTGEVILGEAIRNLSGLDGLDLLTVGHTDPDTADHLGGQAFQRLMSEARLNYHSIVVIADEIVSDQTDRPVDLDRARSLANAVDALIVGTADPVGTAASDELIEALETFGTPILQLVAAPVPADTDTVHESSGV